MKPEEIKLSLKKLLPHKRYEHTLGVCETAVSLAKLYGVSEEKSYIASLLHDCAKNIPENEQLSLCQKYSINLDEYTLSQPQILHSYVGAHLAKDIYGVSDDEVFDAIYYHTTGKENMSLLCKIIFLSDMIEPGRSNIPNLDLIRKESLRNLDLAVLMALDSTILYNIKKCRILHLDSLKARNFLLKNRKDLNYEN